MDPVVSDDESTDFEIKNMKMQLSDFGLDEDNLTKEEMIDLLEALNNSTASAKQDEMQRQKVEENNTIATHPKKSMKRRYLNVKDRRMPWCLFPNTLTPSEKARTLAVYIKLMSINSYRQARQSPNFMSWPPPIQIVEETTRVQPLRSTRSGRSVPVYAGFDDDSSDLDFVVTKKKRKISSSENKETSIISNKSLCLKRKPSKDENTRPMKEARLNSESNKEVSSSQTTAKNVFTIIED